VENPPQKMLKDRKIKKIPRDYGKICDSAGVYRRNLIVYVIVTITTRNLSVHH
jgi:hypothetical protein